MCLYHLVNIILTLYKLCARTGEAVQYSLGTASVEVRLRSVVELLSYYAI